jgi:hypothetical protein
MSRPAYIRTDDETQRLTSIRAKAIMAKQSLDEQDLPNTAHLSRNKSYIEKTKEHDDAVIQRIEDSLESKAKSAKSGSAFAMAFGARKQKTHREIVKKVTKKVSRYIGRKFEAAEIRQCQNDLPSCIISFS